MFERLILENPVQISNILEGIQPLSLSTSQRNCTVVVGVYVSRGSSSSRVPA